MDRLPFFNEKHDPVPPPQQRNALSYKDATVAKPELGTKRTCPETGRKFYDLNKDPIVSPYTGKSYPLSFFEVIKSVIVEEKPKVVEEAVAETEDEDEEEEADGPEVVSLEDVEEDTEKKKKKKENMPELGDNTDDEDDSDDIDVEIDDDDDDDDTFLAADDDDDDDDVTGIIDVAGDDKEDT
jgi:uncharacterized protein (TIGR02300 family)